MLDLVLSLRRGKKDILEAVLEHGPDEHEEEGADAGSDYKGEELYNKSYHGA